MSENLLRIPNFDVASSNERSYGPFDCRFDAMNTQNLNGSVVD